MDISVVVPLLNEAESLPELEAWIRRVMDENGFSYEIVFVDDGSTDNSWAVIQQLSEANPNVKALRFRRNYGKSPALNEGFKVVEGDVVITMDADLQDSPDEIPGLFKMIKEEGYDLVSGWKKVRYDSKLMKNIPSKFFNSPLHPCHRQNEWLWPHRGEGCAPSKAQVRQKQVRLEPFHSRLSRPDYHQLHLEVQQSSDAFLRRVGFVVVFGWFYHLRLSGLYQVFRPCLCLHDPPTVILSRYLGNDCWRAALLNGFPRRDDHLNAA